jgi:hypothetical protein
MMRDMRCMIRGILRTEAGLGIFARQGWLSLKQYSVALPLDMIYEMPTKESYDDSPHDSFCGRSFAALLSCGQQISTCRSWLDFGWPSRQL